VDTRDLPIGIVTFLFTDVEGSTRLQEQLGESYRALQERHDAILRSAIAEGEGREVSTEGDSFFAAFSTPTGAARAAARAQRELAKASWPANSIVRARMGLHTGEGVLGGGSYLGLDVNRAARIAAAAHGGQVVLSDATGVLIQDHLPAGTRLRDLGEHRLKDLLRPEHLHQLVLDALEQDFPPLRTLNARPNNLPAQLTSFVGRQAEIARIRELLTTNRMVTLTGPGGTGKTRLGLQVAAESLTGLRDGVFFVDLSALTDHELVAQEIAAVLRVRADAARSALDRLLEHLRGQELLVVLDNFEQVVDAGPGVLEPLLRDAPAVRALVTSRVPLHLYGEQEFPVPPLVLADPEHLPDLDALLEYEAVALFVERATDRKPDFRITPQNARAVAEITSRLDGLPLAIELAAGRVKLLSPDQLLARLELRLPLLSAQDRNLPERQRTLRRTIEWSYELLDETERRMFWRLAIFVGGADLDAVGAVANPESELGLDTLDGLASLVDKNLLRRIEITEGDPRFGMLETIREYGLERLVASTEEAEIRKRHAEHLIRGAERLSNVAPTDQAVAARRAELDHDNFRAALDWTVGSGEAEMALRLGAALRDFWRLGSHFREGVRWLDGILKLPGAAERTLLRARALTAAADLSSWIRNTDSYPHHAEEAVAIYRDLGDPAGIADALGELGVVQMTVGRGDAARATLEEARGLNLALGDLQKASECTMALSLLAMTEGNIQLAREGFEVALATFRDLGNMYWVAFAERLLGGIERSEGNDRAAEERYRTSLSIAKQHGLSVLIASNLYAFAELALFRGQNERALSLAGTSEAMRERLGPTPSMEIEMMGDVVAAARTMVDEATADRVYREGWATEVDDAIAYALEQP
jgi:predicted ATPase/class 3 adenylate cyclase